MANNINPATSLAMIACVGFGLFSVYITHDTVDHTDTMRRQSVDMAENAYLTGCIESARVTGTYNQNTPVRCRSASKHYAAPLSRTLGGE